MWSMALQENNKWAFEWVILGILQILQNKDYKDISLFTKNKNSNMYLFGCWSLSIIFIATLIYKDDV